MDCLPFDHPRDHLADDRLCSLSTQRHVAPQQLPHIDVGQDDQHRLKLLAPGATPCSKLWFEEDPYGIAVVVATAVERRLKRGPAPLLVEPGHNEVANSLVDFEQRGDRLANIAGLRRPDEYAPVGQLLERCIDELVLATERAQDGLHCRPGPAGDLIKSEVVDRSLAEDVDRARENTLARRRRISGARPHHIGTSLRFHDDSINAKITFMSTSLI